MSREKITPTIKKYSKNIGKLFWYKRRVYNEELKTRVSVYSPCMIMSVGKDYGRCYKYTLIEMVPATDYYYRDGLFTRECIHFKLIPVDTNNPIPPEEMKKIL